MGFSSGSSWHCIFDVKSFLNTMWVRDWPKWISTKHAKVIVAVTLSTVVGLEALLSKRFAVLCAPNVMPDA